MTSPGDGTPERRKTPRSTGGAAPSGGSGISPAIWIIGALVVVAAIILGLRMT